MTATDARKADLAQDRDACATMAVDLLEEAAELRRSDRVPGAAQLTAEAAVWAMLATRPSVRSRTAGVLPGDPQPAT